MTNALLLSTPTIADLLAEARNKDAIHRVGVFIDWMYARRANWLLPDLAAYRDYLLLERGLAPVSVAAHLSTVRGRYQGLLGSNHLREAIHAGAPQAASAAESKALVNV